MEDSFQTEKKAIQKKVSIEAALKLFGSRVLCHYTISCVPRFHSVELVPYFE